MRNNQNLQCGPKPEKLFLLLSNIDIKSNAIKPDYYYYSQHFSLFRPVYD